MAAASPDCAPTLRTAALGLGSNLGERERHLREGLERLERSGRVRVLRVSAFLESEPRGGPPQGRYLNGAAWVETDLEPADLLALLKRVEAEEGRVPGPRWGPRALDVDLLLFGDLRMRSETLEVPHPRMLERAFVLGPLAAIAPEAVHPGLGRTVGEIWEERRAAAAPGAG